MHNADSERRRLRALERLGTNTPKCALCDETNPHCLEQHHIAGRNYAQDTVIHCRNCHRKLSDPQKDHPRQIDHPPSRPERVGHLLLGLADLFAQLAQILRRHGRELLDPAAEDAPAAEGTP